MADAVRVVAAPRRVRRLRRRAGAPESARDVPVLARRVALDGTGLQPTAASEYRRRKWHGGGYTGFVRTVIVVDVDTGLVLGAAVTSDKVPGQKATGAAVLAAMASGLLVPGTGALADAAFAGVGTISFLMSLGLVPVIRLPVTHCRPAGRRPAGS